MNKDTMDELNAVAIIGMAGRFPKARNVSEFWENVCNGVECISFFSTEELLSSGVEASLLKDPNYVRARAVLEDIEFFDAAFFNLTPREAEITSPQHRIFLECAWEALESAGYDPERYPGRIGVYAGMGMNTYLLFNIGKNPDLVASIDPLQLSISNDKDSLTSLVSYRLGLTGPSINVNTMCSTSLVAIHLATQSLLNGECEMALAGGITIKVPQKEGYMYYEGGIRSPDGRCRAFDVGAQGTVGGSGVGIVVLKRLADAIADNDTISAIIRGSAVNNDGRLKVGYTAPSVSKQAEVIIEAQSVAEVEPETITYIETHGTGTVLGDPIEIAALTQAFRSKTEKKGFCAIGSVKTMVGHLDTAAGVTGLIRTALALQHRVLPPSLHFQQPNPQIDFANSPFYVNTRLSDWKPVNTPRRAGVSSFGIGGTNAHVILEEAPPVQITNTTRPWQLLLLSARSATALSDMTSHLIEHLQRHPDLNLADVAYTLQTGRKAFDHRLMFVCQNLQDALDGLKTRAPGRFFTSTLETRKRNIAFMFPGQGSQYIHMARDIYRSEPTFRKYLDYCADILKPDLGLDLRSLLYGREEEAETAQNQLEQTFIAQPTVFSVEYALAKFWMKLGVRPQAMIGHSLGEYVAACLAGVFSLEDALKLVATRGRMMEQLHHGSMLAVPLSPYKLTPLLRGHLSIAAINGPSHCVVSGPQETVAELAQRLVQREIVSRLLHIPYAAHSTMVEPMMDSFAETVKKIHLSAPKIPYISNLTALWITEAEATDPDYWTAHLRQTVRFMDGISRLLQDPSRMLLEVGPGHTLQALVRQHPDLSPEHLIFSSLPHPLEQVSDAQHLLTTLGQLWLRGISIQWPAFYTHAQHRRVPLPTYPFERQRYWIEAPATSGTPAGAIESSLHLQGSRYAPEQETSSQRQNFGPAQHIDQISLFTQRQHSIASSLKNTFSSLFGLTPQEIDPTATFLELGAESLFLLQASQAIENTFHIKVPLRLLLQECATIVSLAAYIDKQLPMETHAFPASVVETQGNHQMETSPQTFINAPSSNNSISARRVNGDMTTQVVPSISAHSVEQVQDIQNAPEMFIPHTFVPRRGKNELTPLQQQHIEALANRLNRLTQGSKQLTQQYRPFLADSKAVIIFNPPLKEMVYPLVVERAAGARVWDIDGNEYIDLAMGSGSLLFGHSPSFVMHALEEQMKAGMRIGMQSNLVGKVARALCEMTGTERAFFCNSGTEAVMTALRLARTATGRTRIAMFAGSFHGTFDGILASLQEQGEGNMHTIPLAPGISPQAVKDVIVLHFGHPESLKILREHAHELAAVLVEPVQSRRPHVQPMDYLRELRQLTEETGIALIFDEVVTGFRSHPGGLQAVLDFQADLTIYGKALGSGMPLGAIAGKAVFMDAVDGGMWSYGDETFPQATRTFVTGTYFKHPFVMGVAWAVLQHMKERGPNLQQELNRRTSQLVQTMQAYFEQERIPVRVVHFSSLFRFVFPSELKLVYANLFFYHLLEKGIYVGEGRGCFLSTAHTDENIAFIIQAVKESIAAMRAGGFFASSSSSLPSSHKEEK